MTDTIIYHVGLHYVDLCLMAQVRRVELFFLTKKMYWLRETKQGLYFILPYHWKFECRLSISLFIDGISMRVRLKVRIFGQIRFSRIVLG